MRKPPRTPVPAGKTLIEQQADFTAEGSPPPGKVATSGPVSAAAPAKAGTPRARSPARRKRPARPRAA